MGATDIPGVLYSNTSKSNLNKESDWVARLGFQLGTHYEAQVTFDDLVLAGRAISAPTAAAAGNVKVPTGANTRDKREYDYIRTDSGSVEESGSHTFSMRGGAGGVGGPVRLSFANNGALNLARLARAAYELVRAKGVTIRGNAIDYKGQTFALGCTVQMGNDLDADAARSFGFVGEFDLRWMAEKVSGTLEILSAAMAAGTNNVMVGDAGSGKSNAMHPNNGIAHLFREDRHERVDGVKSRVRDVTPITSKGFQDPTTQGWGMGMDQQAWTTDIGEIVATTQSRLSSIWAPGGDWRGHPTYISAVPDFSGLIGELNEQGRSSKKNLPKQIRQIQTAMGTICAGLLTSPMNHDLIKKPELQARILKGNRATIQQAFSAADYGRVEGEIEALSHAQRPPTLKGMDAPVAGEAPNGEGLVVLRDWSSRD